MGKSLFILFCLSEIRANDPSGLEWLKKVLQHLGKKNCVVFKLLDFFAVTITHVDVKAHVWKQLFETTKGITFFSVIFYEF